MKVHILADAFHPSEFIRDEMDARGWSMYDLACAMGGDWQINYVGLDFYLNMGAQEPGLRMGNDGAAQLAKAFGTDPDYFANLEKAWLDHPTTRALIASKLN